jgi:tripartite-type tricarboxylate transporter receptor subunit TctC
MKKTLATMLLGACTAFSAVMAHAAVDFPTKPITIIVPYSTGGSADTLSRLMADSLSQKYGKPVVVENRPGAGGHIGANNLLEKPADGHTLMLGTISHNGAYKMYSKLRYDPAKDLVPAAMIAEAPNVLIVPSNSPFKSVQDIINAAKENPGKLNYGSAGVGSGTHMAAELFKHLAGVDITAVPFAGGAPAMIALMAGDVDLIFETGVTATKAVDSGRARAIAVTGKTRSPVFPNIPTVAESGLPPYDMTLWYTLSVKNGTPPETLKKLNADINAIVNTPEFKARLAQLGVDPIIATVEEAVERNRQEEKRWTAVIESSGIKLD